MMLRNTNSLKFELKRNVTVMEFINEIVLSDKENYLKYYKIVLIDNFYRRNVIIYYQDGILKSQYTTGEYFDYNKYANYQIYKSYGANYISVDNIYDFNNNYKNETKLVKPNPEQNTNIEETLDEAFKKMRRKDRERARVTRVQYYNDDVTFNDLVKCVRQICWNMDSSKMEQYEKDWNIEMLEEQVKIQDAQIKWLEYKMNLIEKKLNKIESSNNLTQEKINKREDIGENNYMDIYELTIEEKIEVIKEMINEASQEIIAKERELFELKKDYRKECIKEGFGYYGNVSVTKSKSMDIRRKISSEYAEYINLKAHNELLIKQCKEILESEKKHLENMRALGL